MSGAAEIFADGIGEIALVGGRVRIDLVSLSQTEKNESGEALLELRQRVDIHRHAQQPSNLRGARAV